MEFNIFVAFTAGIISFLSPCIVPILPGYVAYLAGSSISTAEKNRWNIFLASVFFVLGFSAIFSLLGVLLNTLLEAVAYTAQEWLARIGGAIIIFFGLFLTGIFKLPFLEREYRFQFTQKFSSRYLTSFLFGAAFAAGWTPCVGAVLGGILGLAATAPGSAFILLLSYSLGLGLPFLFVGLFTAPAVTLFQKYRYLLRILNVIFGILLIILGILAFTQNLSRVANFNQIF